MPWGRNDFWWGKIEPTQGKYDWKQADATVEAYTKRSINLMPIFCYSSAWYGPKSPADDDEARRYAAYAEAVIDRFKDRVFAWEIWNEPNISQFWSPEPNPEDYVRLLKQTYPRLKGADPSCTVMGCATAGTDIEFIRRVLEAGGGDYFDVLSIHEYFWKDRDAIADFRRIRDLMSQYKLNKPVWITEIGWPTGKKWMTEEEQAKLLVRMFTLSLAEGVQRLFYYNLTDYVPYDSEGWDGRTGLFDVGDIPKASAVAYNQLMYELEGMRYAGKVQLGRDIFGCLFVGGLDQRLVVWTTGKPVEVPIPVGEPEAFVVHMLGRERLVSTPEGVLKLKITDHPQYVRLHTPGLLPETGVDFSPDRFFRGSGVEATVSLKGMVLMDAKKCRLSLPAGWVVSPREVVLENKPEGVDCTFRVTVPETVKAGEYEITALAEGQITIRATKVVAVQDPIRIEVTPPSYLRPGRTPLSIVFHNDLDIAATGTIAVSVGGVAGKPTKLNSVARHSAKSVQAIIDAESFPVGKPCPVDVECKAGGMKANAGFVLDLVGVTKASAPMAIDGKLKDWASNKPLSASVGKHVNLDGTWAGDRDHSAKAWLAWDRDWLYMAVDVTDDRITWPKTDEVWMSDSLQVAFDVANDAVASGYDPRNDFEFGIAKVTGQSRIVRTVSPTKVDLSGAKVAIAEKPAGGAIYEIAIPAKALGVGGFQSGKLMGFSFLVNDSDGTGRKSFFEYAPGIGIGKHPQHFRDIWLVDKQ